MGMTNIFNELTQIYDDLKVICYYVTSEHVPDYIINDDKEEEPGFYALQESVTGLDHLLVILHPDYKDKVFEDTRHRIIWREASKEDWIRANRKKLDNQLFLRR